ncbi:Misato segment II tubulin-like domain-containing protein [Syncephalis plumigaleata]|nr:Misato segment II tubulin-like domain-containing protein [Syncephalis plumigaleata]
MSQNTREILTLQVGAYANFVGAHFWNAQDISSTDTTNDSVDHNVLFQTGETLQGETTFTPRLVVVDTKDHLGYLSANALLGLEEQVQEATPAWSGQVNRIRQPSCSQHNYIQDLNADTVIPEPNGSVAHRYNFDETVRSWPDYLRLYLHPKTLGSGILPKDTKLDWYQQGSDVWQQTGAVHSLLDEELRWFAEACDYLQGFQILSDITNGYGGYTTQLLSELRDEYGKSDMLIFGVSEGMANEQNPTMIRRRIVNTGFSTISLADLATTYVPVEYPHHQYLPDYLNAATTPYASSGLIAAGIDMVSTKYRLKRDASTMSHVTSLLNQREHSNISTLELAFPFLKSPAPECWQSVSDIITRNESFIPLISQRSKTSITTQAQSAVFHCGPSNSLSITLDEKSHPSDMNQLMEAIKYQMILASQTTRVDLTCLDRLYSFPPTFPNSIKRHQFTHGSRQDAIVARLHTSNRVSDLIRSNEVQLKTFDTRSAAIAYGIDRDDYSEMLQSFSDINEAYGIDESTE